MVKIYVSGDEVAAIKPSGRTTVHVSEEMIRYLVRQKYGLSHGEISMGDTKIGLDENGAYTKYDI